MDMQEMHNGRGPSRAQLEKILRYTTNNVSFTTPDAFYAYRDQQIAAAR